MNKDKLVIALDANSILQDIKEKYRDKPTISEKAKKVKEEILKNGDIRSRIPEK